MAMGESAFALALGLLLSGDPGFLQIVALSLRITLTAVLIAALLGLPLGALLALRAFPGRTMLVILLNAFMGLPPVVVGLTVYLLLSRSGPLGPLGLLFTPTAMIIAQTCLVLPIVAALVRQTVADLHAEYDDQLRSLGLGPMATATTLLWDGRFSLLTALLAGFGRASAEVGAVMLVGGNIAGHTRTMTTAIALETSRGDLPLALGLGLVLIAIVILVNAATFLLGRVAERQQGDASA
jgi:tungstate transport system permease protein